MKTVAVTFEGKYARLMRGVFKRAAVLVKLELMEGKSRKNIRYIKGQLTIASSSDEVRLYYKP